MIFYFSGTGNSLYIAKRLAKENKENLISIASVINSRKPTYEYTLEENEVIGFVYPVYAWAPPKMVEEFIDKIKFKNYKNNYIFSIATCGENIGNTMKVVDKYLKKKNLGLNSGFSIKMPSNYIVMGDIETKEKQDKKFLEAEDALININGIIKDRKDGVFQINKGFMPSLLTTVINPLFNKKAIDTKKFYADNNCIACGLCQRVCNCQSIEVYEKPVWGSKCSQCLACVHLCPTSAIQYGKGTEGKRRYKNPNISIDEMHIYNLTR